MGKRFLIILYVAWLVPLLESLIISIRRIINPNIVVSRYTSSIFQTVFNAIFSLLPKNLTEEMSGIALTIIVVILMIIAYIVCGIFIALKLGTTYQRGKKAYVIMTLALLLISSLLSSLAGKTVQNHENNVFREKVDSVFGKITVTAEVQADRRIRINLDNVSPQTDGFLMELVLWNKHTGSVGQLGSYKVDANYQIYPSNPKRLIQPEIQITGNTVTLVITPDNNGESIGAADSVLVEFMKNGKPYYSEVVDLE